MFFHENMYSNEEKQCKYFFNQEQVTIQDWNVTTPEYSECMTKTT